MTKGLMRGFGLRMGRRVLLRHGADQARGGASAALTGRRARAAERRASSARLVPLPEAKWIGGS
ncbi:hypothetical protein K9U39_15835 [Rhodoblastus acidophilus]|nr:hypothetical protein [Rhodoblastus acidophilus]